MASVEDLDVNISSSAAEPEMEEIPPLTSAPPPSTTSTTNRSRFSVHGAFGGGGAADVLLWKRRNAGILVLVGASAAWYLFEIAGYSFLCLAANALLLLVTILFFWARSASLLNRPLPPLPNLEVSDQVAEKLADEARVWINHTLAVARDIALGGDRNLFLKIILGLWAVSYIGSFFNFLTLVYIGIVLSLTVPALYDKYQDHVDEKLGLGHGFLLKQYECILSKTSRSTKKEKKIE